MGFRLRMIHQAACRIIWSASYLPESVAEHTNRGSACKRLRHQPLPGIPSSVCALALSSHPNCAWPASCSARNLRLCVAERLPAKTAAILRHRPQYSCPGLVGRGRNALVVLAFAMVRHGAPR